MRSVRIRSGSKRNEGSMKGKRLQKSATTGRKPKRREKRESEKR